MAGHSSSQMPTGLSQRDSSAQARITGGKKRSQPAVLMSLAVAEVAALWFSVAMGSHIPRLWLPQMGAGHTTLTISDADKVHHLKDVLRLKAGEAVHIFNQTMGEYTATVVEVKKQAITLQLDAARRAPEVTPEVHIYFAPLKRQATEFLIEKVTELGATHLHPVITAHTQVRSINHDRLMAIAIDAAEQCARLNVPTIAEPIDLFALRPETPLLAAQESTRAVSHSLQQVLATHKDACSVLIGPEGGFSEAEDAWLAKQSNIISVSLGRNILRAETAAILACGIISLYREAP